MQRETSYAEENSKRLTAATQAMLQSSFQTTVQIVDLLMEPLDAAMNQLLKRTTCLKKLRFEDTLAEELESIPKLKEGCRALFLSWASGQFGEKIMQDYLRNLASYELADFCRSCHDPAMPRTFF